jgi:hypothetical protein
MSSRLLTKAAGGGGGSEGMDDVAVGDAGEGLAAGGFGTLAGLLASSSAMMRRIEASISSIEGS